MRMGLGEFIGLLGRKCACRKEKVGWVSAILKLLIKHCWLNRLGDFSLFHPFYELEV
jgi:hypothetical protein